MARAALTFCRVVALSLFPIMMARGELVLSRRGSPAVHRIVIRADADAVERFAAGELQTYIARMTGVELPIAAADRSLSTPVLRIALAEDASAGPRGSVAVPNDLGAEGFLIRVDGESLAIAARRPRGVLYGVYELLERFGGCAWYSPTFEVVPRRESFAVPDTLDERQLPAFALRETSVGALGHAPEFSIRNRLNFSWLKEFGAAEYRYDPKLRKCHTFEELLPVRKWFSTHPEYFSMVNGRRLGFQTQLCLTNPEVIERCTEVVMARIAESRPKGIRHYGISPNDWGNWCTCPNCAAIDRRERSHSGTLIAFVNAIAEKVEAKYPDVVIQTLAYSYTRRPPARLRPRRNVLVCLCTIECDFARSLVESRSIENRRTREAFRQWGDVPGETGRHALGVWDYTANFASYIHPWPNFYTLQGNLRFFRSSGVQEVYEQGNGGGPNDIWSNIRIWLVAKWLWNPDRDADELLTKCFADHFGPASPEIRAAFEQLHALPRDTKLRPMICFENIFSSSVPVEALERMAPLFESAAAKVAGTEYARRVHQARAPLDLTLAIRGLAMPCARRDVAMASAEEFARQREGARRVVELMDAPGGLRLASDLTVNAQLERRLRSFAARERLPEFSGRLTVEESELIGFFPTGFSTLSDPLAVDGRAVCLPASHDTCIAWLLFNSIRTDPEGVYLVRIRVRVGDAAESAIAFRAGLCNLRTNRSHAFSEPKVETLRKGRYTWYTVGTCTPRRGDAMWIDLADAPDHPDVFIDQIQLIQL